MKAQRAVGMLLVLSHRAVGGVQGRSVGAGCQWEWGGEKPDPGRTLCGKDARPSLALGALTPSSASLFKDRGKSLSSSGPWLPQPEATFQFV